jgi:hypothetical protein
MTMRTWRNRAGFVCIPIFIVNAVAYACRCLMHRKFYEDHSSMMVVCAEIGFVVSVVALALALAGLPRKWKLVMCVGSLVITYLWFSDIAFWVMVK